MAEVRVEPVVVDDEPQLYDAWVGGEWVGSRRTLEQLRLYLEGIGVRWKGYEES